jgi:hypothetical protein
MSQETASPGSDPGAGTRSEQTGANGAAGTLTPAQSEAVEALPTPQRAAVRPLFTAANQLAQVDTSEPQQVAAASTNLLSSYYTVALIHSRRSFNWALIAAGVGLIFFLGAVAFVLIMQSTEVATVSLIGGAITELISGLNFYLYGRATEQLADYRRSLEQTQRFLLANSIAETLQTDKDKARADLVNTIAQWGRPSSQSQEARTPSSDQQKPRRRGSRRRFSRNQESEEPSQ